MNKIVEYNSAYEKQVKDLIVEIFTNEYGYSNCKEEIYAENLDEYKENNGNLWVALDEEKKVIGCVGIKHIDESIAELKRMYVNPNCRGKGISKELLQMAEEFVKAKSYKKIILSTRDNLERAIAFYGKNGFVRVSVENTPNGVVYMEKSI